jgi:hypothetical protein
MKIGSFGIRLLERQKIANYPSSPLHELFLSSDTLFEPPKPVSGVEFGKSDSAICRHFCYAIGTFGRHLRSKVGGDLVYLNGRKMMQVVQITKEKKPVAERIDPSRYATCVGVDRIDSARIKRGIGSPANLLEAVDKILAAFFAAHRAKVIGRNDPLPKLLKIGI